MNPKEKAKLERTIALMAGAFFELYDQTEPLVSELRPQDPTLNELMTYFCGLYDDSIEAVRPLQQVKYTDPSQE